MFALLLAQAAAPTPAPPTATPAAPATPLPDATADAGTGAGRIIIDLTGTPGAKVEVVGGAGGGAGGAAVPAPGASPALLPRTPTGSLSRHLQSWTPETGYAGVDAATRTLVRSLGDLLEGLIANLPEIVLAILVLLITGFIARLLFNGSRKLFGRLRLKPNLRDLFSQLVYIAAWFVGLIVAAGIVFPSFGFAQIVATAGLASIAVGFAFQDIFANFFAGILILWRFPFRQGDFIEIEGTQVAGKVEDVWIRMTLVRQVDGSLQCVPNSTVYKNPVRVLTSRSIRRQTVICGIAYGESIADGRRVMQQAVEACRTVEKNQPVQIFAQAFGASSIDFEVTWWCGATPLEQRKSRDEVVEAVKRGLDEAGIEIPYPYRTLTFTKNEPLIAEALRGIGRRGAGGERRGGVRGLTPAPQSPGLLYRSFKVTCSSRFLSRRRRAGYERK